MYLYNRWPNGNLPFLILRLIQKVLSQNFPVNLLKSNMQFSSLSSNSNSKFW